MPAGSETTWPPPAPTNVTLSGLARLKPAPMVRSLSTLIVHGPSPAPAHAPDQPVKREPLSAVAVTLSAVPAGTAVSQSGPQSSPPPATLPVPVPALRAETVKKSGAQVEVSPSG
jgi:hypothetical protein